MNDLQHPDTESVIARFRCWIERVVIELNLCPFARQPYEGKQIRFVVSNASEPELLLTDLECELELLRETDTGKTETTLLIHPEVLHDFIDYNNFLGIVDQFLEQGGYTGEFQVASFHPDYCFADTDADDASNYTNRSPYPALHLLREASIEQALESVATPEKIPERNIRTLNKLGADHMRAILAECLEKEL